jgi:hypothetical protein
MTEKDLNLKEVGKKLLKQTVKMILRLLLYWMCGINVFKLDTDGIMMKN